MKNLANLSQFSPWARQLINWIVTVTSVILCLVILPSRLPGMELLGISPNWLLIWVVAWSLKRTALQGALAGLALGLIQDGMTSHDPTHVVSLALVGVLTARLQKQRYIQEDFISVALIVFGMAVVGETIIAIQYSLMGDRNLTQIWADHQRIALSSAILSSLWAPVVYYPLNRWWERINLIEQS
ncbi:MULTISPECIES: rod shape-determining protein MreD [unclassified Coleofasciculus]|uniref:rod shape-determining protein MreD n=1 Tax=unclassified Coleofasciculus TaxID=2692782 RepID=UPI001882255C|nr:MULTISPECIES: rod shape-determining protein MreD [unclassified Coleofasciculus]MBE9128473.1 rod shape-determining protein MreD [Coleofasciculus sp. LEGE 07081]MBE9149268.1 rod shape-determining protein MreD [Coleofasciculus sp. LEGE 07092]